MLRRPSIGLRSGSSARSCVYLSAPRSKVRIVSGRPASCSADARYSSNSSCSVGGCGPVRYRISVRNRPTPSPPLASTWSISRANSMLPSSWMRTPSIVSASFEARICISAASSAIRCMLSRKWRSVFSSGRTTTMPARPSITISSPSLTNCVTRWHPTTTGMPSALATIEAWLVRPPASAAKPSTLFTSSDAAWVGVRSWDTTMTGSFRRASRSRLCPTSLPSRRRSRSITSPAFCRKTSLPMSRKRWARARNASATA